MPVLNFTEIPQSNLASGQQDTFELFARDFFEMLGFRIEEEPDRGQDGGRDLIIIEQRTGILGTTDTKWLVSCKHKAHSGRSVNDNDEVDISDRVRAHGADGFMGFYSTIISSPLARKLRQLEEREEIKVYRFDNEKIEKSLLENEQGKSIIRRYFPNSYKELWPDENQPSNLFSTYEPLSCCVCQKDLLTDRSGIVVFVYDPKKTNKCVSVYWACKICDDGLNDHLLENGYSSGWEDISDIIIPSHYLSWNMAVLNRLRSGEDKYTDDSFEELKTFILRVSQLVLRKQSEDQMERFRTLISLPPL